MAEKKTNFWDFANGNAGCLIPAAVIALFIVACIIEDIFKH